MRRKGGPFLPKLYWYYMASAHNNHPPRTVQFVEEEDLIPPPGNPKQIMTKTSSILGLCLLTLASPMLFVVAIKTGINSALQK